jgi:peptide/nickel transport system substrate-binding protein
MLRSRALIFLLVGLLAGALLAGGCKARPETSTAAGSTPRRGGTAVVGWPAQPASVNELIVPPSQITKEVIFQMFLHLTEEQPDFQEHPASFKPTLAERWEWSADHKTLTFHLRPGVLWSDGVPVTADDVRWTWTAQRDPAIAWNEADAKKWMTDVEVVDPRTVRFHYSRVYAKQFLDANEGVILPRHAWEKVPFADWRKSGDWFRQHLVVDGPFTIAAWEPQQQIVLQRNPRYYRQGYPLLDRVVIRQIADTAAGFTQLLSGDVDFLPQVNPADMARVKKDPRLELITYWANLVVTVDWNNDQPLFRDPEVRRALTFAIDRKTIVDTILGPLGRVASTPYMASIWAHDRTIQPLPYDPEQARRILAAKGWKDTDGDGILDKGGKPFAFELITNAGNSLRADATVMIQSQLRKVGIRVTPRQVEFNTLIDQTNNGTYQAAMFGSTVDTSLDLTNNFHSSMVGEDGNLVRYRNPEVDRLLETAAAQADPLAERPYLERIQQILHRDQPATFLWESQRPTAINRRLHDVKPSPNYSLFQLEEWWVTPKV